MNFKGEDFLLAENTKKLIKEHTLIDHWFPWKFSFNVFSGCEYSCVYCRANWRKEKKIIYKKNILAQLQKELTPIPQGSLIGIGGGVNETFSFNQEKNQKVLEVIDLLITENYQPVIMTKNLAAFYQATKNFWKKYPQGKFPIIIYSYSGLSNQFHALLEKDIPVIDFGIIEKVKQAGFKLGIFLSPIIPWVNDDLNNWKDIIATLKHFNLDFLLVDFLDTAGLGRLSEKLSPLLQEEEKNFFEKILASRDNYQRYQLQVAKALTEIIIANHIPLKIPHAFFCNKVSLKDEVTIILYYIFFYKNILEKDEKNKSFYYAAFNINKLPFADWQEKIKSKNLTTIKGVGEVISKVISEIILKRNYSYLDDVLKEVYPKS